jgi:hypothetical protein
VGLAPPLWSRTRTDSIEAFGRSSRIKVLTAVPWPNSSPKACIAATAETVDPLSRRYSGAATPRAERTQHRRLQEAEVSQQVWAGLGLV